MKGFIATDADGFSAIYTDRPICNGIGKVGHCYVPMMGARIPLTTELTTGIGEMGHITLADLLDVPKSLIKDAKKAPIEVLLTMCEVEPEPQVSEMRIESESNF